ncbi:hypothetical protein Hokovirus_1_114 [Hokovirus HKV1]|uniref:Transmembrane protein n=1 Tax=Hokovirus HKV1 TaxID=1977638 RepID=A0A1V0SET5_9VIRU|nr:hypothetical protein Hokovirus_1_114 [Hokovirus HKV1]
MFSTSKILIIFSILFIIYLVCSIISILACSYTIIKYYYTDQDQDQKQDNYSTTPPNSNTLALYRQQPNHNQQQQQNYNQQQQQYYQNTDQNNELLQTDLSLENLKIENKKLELENIKLGVKLELEKIKDILTENYPRSSCSQNLSKQIDPFSKPYTLCQNSNGMCNDVNKCLNNQCLGMYYPATMNMPPYDSVPISSFVRVENIL